MQRWLKFAKYLPEFGWEPYIITVDAEYAAFPVLDFSLNKDELPPANIYSTPATDYFSIYGNDRSKIPSAGFANSLDSSLKGKLIRFIRGNFFIPDPRKGWNKYAFRKAVDLIDSSGIKHVITTSPPHSTQLIGLKIKRKYPAIKWIADLRDPWTDIYYYRQFYPTMISRWIDSSYEKKVLENADRIITVGNSLKRLFESKMNSPGDKIEVITNGYDEDDFNIPPEPVPLIFTITYVGTLSDIYPVESLLNALQNVRRSGNKFLVRFIGTVSFKQKNLIASKLEEEEVQFISYTEHAKAIKYMTGSSLLLLIIPDHESSKSILTGKIFEYIASGRPVLCLGPADGDAAGILRSSGRGDTAGYYDSGDIEKIIMKIIGGFVYPKKNINMFARKYLAERLSGILE